MAHLAKSSFWLVFVNEVLLELSQALLLLLSMTVCMHYNSKLELLPLAKLKIFTIWPFTPNV